MAICDENRPLRKGMTGVGYPSSTIVDENSITRAENEGLVTTQYYKFHQTPQPVGCWRTDSGDMSWYMIDKPRWFTRLMVKWCFQMNWVDNANT